MVESIPDIHYYQHNEDLHLNKMEQIAKIQTLSLDWHFVWLNSKPG